MRQAILGAIIFLLSTVSSGAQNPIAVLPSGDNTIELYPNGFWRYSDEAEPTCTTIDKGASVCAFPSQWAPIPNFTVNKHIEFIGKDQLLGQFVVFFDREGVGLTLESSLQFTIEDLRRKGARALSDLEQISVDGEIAYHLPVVFDHLRTVKAISLFARDGVIAQAETIQTNVGLYHDSHRQLHLDFLNTLKIEKQR